MPHTDTSSNVAALSATKSVTLPAIGANATGTVSITDPRIVANANIDLHVRNNNADNTATRGVYAWVEGINVATHTVIVGYHSNAAMSAAWSLQYKVY